MIYIKGRFYILEGRSIYSKTFDLREPSLFGRNLVSSNLQPGRVLKKICKDQLLVVMESEKIKIFEVSNYHSIGRELTIQSTGCNNSIDIFDSNKMAVITAKNILRIFRISHNSDIKSEKLAEYQGNNTHFVGKIGWTVIVDKNSKFVITSHLEDKKGLFCSVCVFELARDYTIVLKSVMDTSSLRINELITFNFGDYFQGGFTVFGLPWGNQKRKILTFFYNEDKGLIEELKGLRIPLGVGSIWKMVKIEDGRYVGISSDNKVIEAVYEVINEG